MHPTRPTRFEPHAVAAAVALLLASALPAQAQSFSQGGANGTSPNSLLPFVGSPSSLDFTGNRMYVGAGGVGSFSALAGAVLSADALLLGAGSTDIGTFTANGVNAVTGVRTQVLLGGGGQVNRLEIGNWGTGTLTVSGGALVDATVNAAACTPSSWCYTFIGNAAGSTATVNITGRDAATNTPSELRALRNFTVGQTSVFTLAADGFDFGTPGGTTNATVNVSGGGKLSTERASVGSNNASPRGLGTEKANGTVVVSGAGSTWIARHNSIDNQSAFIAIGDRAGGTGTVTISNQGRLTVDSSATPQGALVNIGQNGGKGTLTVTGSGSVLELINSGAIQVGRNAATEASSFNLLAGATASATFLNAGRDGATGMVLIDGPGSTLTLTGIGLYASGGLGAAVGTIGWVGTGKVTVANGALWQINDGGTDTSANGGRGPGITIGTSGGNGTVEIKGSNSLVSLNSSSIGPESGNPDNANPYVNLGLGTGSTGTLDVSAGGRLLLNGAAISTPTFGRGTALAIGGNSDTTLGGTGTVTVSGSGSAIRLTGTDAFVSVGRNGTGTLDINNGGTLQATIINVGRAASGMGTMTMDAATVDLSGFFTDSVGSGAGLTVGNRGGTGSLSMSNGSTVSITNLSAAGAGLNLGGTTPNPLGNGTLTMSGGSSITITAGPGLASATVGRDGTGLATLTGASQIDIGDGSLHVGRLATGSGTVTLAGGSKFLAGSVNIGGSSESVAGGTGVFGIAGSSSELRASGASGFIGVGRNGNGTLTVTDQGTVAAIVMSVGRGTGGVGTLTATDATLTFSGQQTSGNQSGAGLGIGTAAGTGTATLFNTTVTVTNPGSSGGGIVIGGSANFPTGSGTLTMINSSITVNANAGLGEVNVGRSGTGVATLSASTINNAGGNVYVGREAGATGVLSLSNGSVINAAYVGAGTTQPYDGVAHDGGSGVIVLNDSTINAGMFELGAAGVLTGNNGVLNVAGDVVIGGIVSPGNSPGRLRINCNLIMLPGSKIVLEVSGGPGNYEVDQLIIGSEATFDLASAQIEFNFLGETNPNLFVQSGGLNLDNFLRTAAPGSNVDKPLSERFDSNVGWAAVVNTAKISAVSETYQFQQFRFDGAGNLKVEAVRAVPEPSTWGLMALGLLGLGAVARRRRGMA